MTALPGTSIVTFVINLDPDGHGSLKEAQIKFSDFTPELQERLAAEIHAATNKALDNTKKQIAENLSNAVVEGSVKE